MKEKSEPIQFSQTDPADRDLKLLLAAVEKERTPKKLRDLAERLQDELNKRKSNQ